MQLNSQRKNRELNLLEILSAILHRIWIVLLAAVACGCISLLVTKLFITPVYESSVMFYVNNGAPKGENERISNSDITASQSLVDTYLVILRSSYTLNDVVNQAGLQYSVPQLAAKITASSVNETEIFQVTVKDEDPEVAARIASTIADVLPEKVASVIDGSTVRIITNAVEGAAPSSPNVKRNVLFGVVLGVLLSCILIGISAFLDDTLYDVSEYIKQTQKQPILGEIPELLQSEQSGRYVYYSSGTES